MIKKLMQWPCKMDLVPVYAPYFDEANLLIAADCTAFAYESFHTDFINNHITLIGCPMHNCDAYTEKLTKILSNNNILSIKVVRMDVPCCKEMENAVSQAVAACGKDIPVETVLLTTYGKIL